MAGTYVDEAREVSLLDVVKDRSLVEAGQVSHVLLFVVLGRVHLLHVVLADQHPLASLLELHLHIVPLASLHAGGHEALALMRHPDQLLLGPLGLGGGVSEAVPVHHQELEVGIRPVHISHDWNLTLSPSSQSLISSTVFVSH